MNQRMQGKEGHKEQFQRRWKHSDLVNPAPPVPAASMLTWGLEFSIDEGEQLLADAAVRNRPGQEPVVGAGCLQKKIRVWWEVWCLGWRQATSKEI